MGQGDDAARADRGRAERAARRKLRKHLKEQGLSVDALLGEET